MAISRYPLESGEIKSIHAKLLYVTYSKYENDWPSLPHTHYFTELCYIKKGNGKYLIDEQIFPVKEDDFIIINPNVAHTEISVGSVPLEYIILGVEGLDFSIKDSEHLILNCRQDHTDFLFYMNALLQEMEAQSPDYELICQDLLEVLIIKLIRRTHLTFESLPAIKSGKECTKLKHYIDSNYAQDISLDTLSKISHLNKYYMVHAFTKQFGISPMNYLCEVRIKISKELLSSTDMSITEIAQSSGFSSQSYFAQCFQKHCGMTASAYRKKCRKG